MLQSTLYETFRFPSEDGNNSHNNSGVHETVKMVMFGVFDGLCTNANIIIGIYAGQAAGAGAQTRWLVSTVGVASMLAGASSMACGEVVASMYENLAVSTEIKKEERHHETIPQQEATDMTQLLRTLGFSDPTVKGLSSVIEKMSQPERVLFHTRFELCIDHGEPSASGVRSCHGHATSGALMWIAFSVGALVPLLPWLVLPKTYSPAVVAMYTLATTLGFSVAISSSFVWFVQQSGDCVPHVRSAVIQIGMLILSVAFTALLNAAVTGRVGGMGAA